MIEHTEIITSHRVTCNLLHPKLISTLTPLEGYTVWCQRCKRVEMVKWEELPHEVLVSVQSRLSEMLAMQG